MKKIFAIGLFSLVITSCHYGEGDAKKTLETNEQYKNEKAEYSTNRGNDGVMPEHAKTVVDSVKTDTTAKK